MIKDIFISLEDLNNNSKGESLIEIVKEIFVKSETRINELETRNKILANNNTILYNYIDFLKELIIKVNNKIIRILSVLEVFYTTFI